MCPTLIRSIYVGIWITPCESWPTRLAATMWRMTNSASARGAPAASNSAWPISVRRSAAIFGIVSSRAPLRSGRGGDMGGAHQPQRLGVAAHLCAGVLHKVLILARHRRRDHLDHQAVFEPELDHVKERLMALHAASIGLGVPALARTDVFDVVRLPRHREEHVEGPGMRRRGVVTEHDL